MGEDNQERKESPTSSIPEIMDSFNRLTLQSPQPHFIPTAADADYHQVSAELTRIRQAFAESNARVATFEAAQEKTSRFAARQAAAEAAAPTAAPTAAPLPPAGRSYNAVPPPASFVTAAATTFGFPSMGKWSHLDRPAAASLPYSSSATETELLWNKVFVDAQRRFIHLHQRAAATAEARGRGGRGSGRGRRSRRDRRDRDDRQNHNRPYNLYF
ncbi:uncharacterized protein LOC143208963 [Lasioglossum baleicum]|uniref:uncharacterized protein LOC143208963 n=1 Tax=Lasioglossum baleicum TaxID=434251 RepID=UPI003FCDF223